MIIKTGGQSVSILSTVGAHPDSMLLKVETVRSRMTIYNLQLSCSCYYMATVLFHCDPFVDFINIADHVNNIADCVIPTEYVGLCKFWY